VGEIWPHGRRASDGGTVAELAPIASAGSIANLLLAGTGAWGSTAVPAILGAGLSLRMPLDVFRPLAVACVIYSYWLVIRRCQLPNGTSRRMEWLSGKWLSWCKAIPLATLLWVDRFVRNGWSKMLKKGHLNRTVPALLAGVLVLCAAPALAQSQLPPCPTGQNIRRHMCFGTYTFPDGHRFAGDRYVGEFRDDNQHGQGTYTHLDGTEYEGEFRDGKYYGQGTYTLPNGRKYVGEFRDGQFNGKGIYIFPDGARYVGEFRGGKFHGQGIYTFPDGVYYVGEYKDNQRYGQGSVFSRDQRLLRNGIWRNGELLQANDLPNPVLSAQRSPASPQSNLGTSVRLIREAGTFKVPVRINGVLELHFTVDSGASDVTIPADVVMTLRRTGTIRDSDFIGEQTYRLADGSTIKSRTFRIRHLQVGARTIDNVLGSVANVEGSLLLGQSFLSRFQRVSFDYGQGVLVLE
jgi:hypothetical protein